MAQQPNLGLGRLIIDVSRSNTQLVGHLWESDRLVATYTTHKEHKKLTSLLSAGLEPAIPEIKRLQTFALDRTATGMDYN